MRPGRFDRQVIVGKPNVKEREAILRIHAHNKILADDVNLEILARSTPGFTAADLENLLNEGTLFAVRHGRNHVIMDDLEEAISRILAGPAKKSRVDSERTRRITAYHEAGHCFGWALYAKYRSNPHNYYYSTWTFGWFYHVLA